MIITPWSHGGHVRKFIVHLSAMASNFNTPEFARAVATIAGALTSNQGGGQQPNVTPQSQQPPQSSPLPAESTTPK